MKKILYMAFWLILALFLTVPVGAQEAAPSVVAPAEGAATFDFTKEGFGELFITNYPLGPGDQLSIKVLTLDPFEEKVQIGSDGKLILPILGEIDANGLTIPQLRDELTKRYKEYYSEFTVSIDLTFVKKIQVYLYGSIPNPGIYTVFANTTLLEFLQKANLSTSGRNRRLIHHRGDVATEIDPFRLSVLGEIEQHNMYLQFGDRIEVPIPQVSISLSGNILRPGVYEVLSGETLRDIVELAGGPDPFADMSDTVVDRPKPDGTFDRIHIDLVKIWNRGQQFELQNRDTVNIPGRDINVYLLGAVKLPGRYQFIEGKGVEQYLAEAGGFDNEAQLSFVTVIRPGPRYGNQVSEKFHVNLKEVLKEKFDKQSDRNAFETKRVILQPGDVIMVPFKGTEERNRNLSLVLTILQNLLQSYLIFKK